MYMPSSARARPLDRQFRSAKTDTQEINLVSARLSLFGARLTARGERRSCTGWFQGRIAQST